MNPAQRKRLQEEYAELRQLVVSSGGTLELAAATGNPPTRYELKYRCRGIASVQRGKPVYRHEHRVAIELPADYPWSMPRVTVLSTPNFHPHIYTNNNVCLGRQAINEGLVNLALRVGGILQFEPRYFDFDSPAKATEDGKVIRELV